MRSCDEAIITRQCARLQHLSVGDASGMKPSEAEHTVKHLSEVMSCLSRSNYRPYPINKVQRDHSNCAGGALDMSVLLASFGYPASLSEISRITSKLSNLAKENIARFPKALNFTVQH